MIAERVEETVGIGNHSRRRERDDVAQTRAGRSYRQSRNQSLVDIGVSHRDVFDYIRGVAGYGYCLSCAANRERDLQANWDRSTHRQSLRRWCEAGA